MEGYKYFVDGWVSKVLVHHIPPGSGEEKQVAIVIASVKHSQRLSSTPLKVWVAAEMLGTVLCAHCICMAGLGEACSHIAAVLFTMEANTRIRGNVSCPLSSVHGCLQIARLFSMLLFQILTSQPQE